jgi:hypothetical protein
MKYFKPELLDQLNRSIVDEKSQRSPSALDQWGRNSAAYEKRLENIRERVEPTVLELMDHICFHDAQLLNLSYQDDDKIALLLVQKDRLHVFTCTLRSPPSLTSPDTAPSFASVGLFWLYEEVDLDRNKTVLRVLLSDGSELELPITRVTLQSFDVRPRNGRKAPKAIRHQFGKDVSAAEYALFELSPLIPPRDRLSKEVRFPIEFRVRDSTPRSSAKSSPGRADY